MTYYLTPYGYWNEYKEHQYHIKLWERQVTSLHRCKSDKYAQFAQDITTGCLKNAPSLQLSSKVRTGWPCSVHEVGENEPILKLWSAFFLGLTIFNVK